MPTYKPADILLSTNKKWNIVNAVQKYADNSKAVHAAMVYTQESDVTVITIESNFNGLNFMERTIGEYDKVIRITDLSPFAEVHKQSIMADYLLEKDKNKERDYPIGCVIISAINRLAERKTNGRFRRIDFGAYRGNSDCSTTVAELVYIMWPGRLIRRNGLGLVTQKLVTPGDIENGIGFEVIKNWG